MELVEAGGVATCRSALDARGFASLGPLLDASTLGTLRKATDEAYGALAAEATHDGALAPHERGGYGILRHDLWREVEAFARELERGELGALARALLDAPEVVLFQDHLIWKTPGAGEVRWHQDASYWPLMAPESASEVGSPARGLTFWIALDDADAENGCLDYLPGTHRLGERAPADFMEGAAQPTRPGLLPLELEARASDAVSVPCRAGEGLAHHPLVVHRSPPNASTRRRRAWSLTWVTADTRWDPGRAPHPYVHTIAGARGTELAGGPFLVF